MVCGAKRAGKNVRVLGAAKSSQMGFLYVFLSIVNACKATVQTVRTIRARVHAHVHVHVHVVHAYVVLVRLLLDNYYK